MVWRDTPALRGGGFELLLDYNWIKKGALERGFGSAVWPLGCWNVVTQAGVCSNVIFCLWLWGVVSSLLAFQ